MDNSAGNQSFHPNNFTSRARTLSFNPNLAGYVFKVLGDRPTETSFRLLSEPEQRPMLNTTMPEEIMHRTMTNDRQNHTMPLQESNAQVAPSYHPQVQFVGIHGPQGHPVMHPWPVQQVPPHHMNRFVVAPAPPMQYRPIHQMFPAQPFPANFMPNQSMMGQQHAPSRFQPIPYLPMVGQPIRPGQVQLPQVQYLPVQFPPAQFPPIMQQHMQPTAVQQTQVDNMPVLHPQNLMTESHAGPVQNVEAGAVGEKPVEHIQEAEHQMKKKKKEAVKNRGVNQQAVVSQEVDGMAEEAKAKDAKAENAKTEEAKTEEAKTEEAKTEEAKTGEAKTEDATAKDAKTENAKTEEAKTGEAKTEDATAKDAKTENAKTEEAKTEEAKTEDATAKDAKTDNAKTEDATAKDAKTEDAKTEDAKTEDAKTEDAKTEDAKTEDAKTEDAKAENAKAADAKAADAKAADAKAADAKAEKAKAAETKAEKAKAEKAKAEKAKAEKAKAEKAKAADAKAEKAKAEKAKAAETKAAETKAAEAKAAETKEVETKAAEAKAAETKEVEIKETVETCKDEMKKSERMLEVDVPPKISLPVVHKNPPSLKTVLRRCIHHMAAARAQATKNSDGTAVEKNQLEKMSENMIGSLPASTTSDSTTTMSKMFGKNTPEKQFVKPSKPKFDESARLSETANDDPRVAVTKHAMTDGEVGITARGDAKSNDSGNLNVSDVPNFLKIDPESNAIFTINKENEKKTNVVNEEEYFDANNMTLSIEAYFDWRDNLRNKKVLPPDSDDYSSEYQLGDRLLRHSMDHTISPIDSDIRAKFCKDVSSKLPTLELPREQLEQLSQFYLLLCERNDVTFLIDTLVLREYMSGPEAEAADILSWYYSLCTKYIDKSRLGEN